ncbi:MAG: TRAP transporter small permease [Thermoanaerobacteraceae bacterium]|nr:TRAP transporter small permease [Thermoanaerobacteraceae bacterium]
MLKVLDKIEEYICAAILMFISTIAFINVIVRYLTNYSFAFSEELQINLFVWLTLLGASMGLRKGAHLGVSMLVEKFPVNWRKVITVFIGICSVGLFVLLLVQGIDLVAGEFRNKMTTYSMGLPMWWFGMGIPVGAVFLIIRAIQVMVEEFNNLSKVNLCEVKTDKTE